LTLEALPRAQGERVPPNNLEAEASVLGSLMIDPDAIGKVADFLHPEDFYRPAHGAIYGAIRGLFERGEPIDNLSVAEELSRQEMLERIGGTSVLFGLIGGVPTAANVEHYARIVESKAVLRRLIAAGGQIASIGFEEAMETDLALDQAQQIIFQIAENRVTRDFEPVSELLRTEFERIERVYREKEIISGVPTPWPQLNAQTSGFQAGDLILVAARPGMGKTSLALNIAQFASMRESLKVAIFSLEMGGGQLVQRILCSEAHVSSHSLRTGYVRDEEWQRLASLSLPMAEASMWIDDTAGISVLEMRAKARRLKATSGLDLVIIDYLQLMQSHTRSESRVQEVSDISRGLKSLARELRLPVIALSQLSREVEKRSPHIPMLSDLRESGSLEQDSDLVLFLYSEDYYKEANQRPEMPVVQLHLAKHRNGPTGSVDMVFIPRETRFEEKARG
jgi:replicative DNA helicase